jgi:hypothetical protein
LKNQSGSATLTAVRRPLADGAMVAQRTLDPLI